MSIEAQFYEARRRQNVIERRQSLRTEQEMEKQRQQAEYQTLYIPVRVLRQSDKQGRCTCTAAIHRMHLTRSDQSLFQRDRDIYPRPSASSTNIRRHFHRAKLPNRFTSVNYLQQW